MLTVGHKIWEKGNCTILRLYVTFTSLSGFNFKHTLTKGHSWNRAKYCYGCLMKPVQYFKEVFWVWSGLYKFLYKVMTDICQKRSYFQAKIHLFSESSSIFGKLYVTTILQGSCYQYCPWSSSVKLIMCVNSKVPSWQVDFHFFMSFSIKDVCPKTNLYV